MACSSTYSAPLSSRAAAAAEINELNVFPVPDGDTGTNMSMTIGAAAEEMLHAGGPAHVILHFAHDGPAHRHQVYPIVHNDVQTEKGLITISSDVFSNITGAAATNCYGVKGMAIRPLVWPRRRPSAASSPTGTRSPSASTALARPWA